LGRPGGGIEGAEELHETIGQAGILAPPIEPGDDATEVIAQILALGSGLNHLLNQQRQINLFNHRDIVLPGVVDHAVQQLAEAQKILLLGQALGHEVAAFF
jgi:hypothetical protein